jgi:cytochrome P450
VSGIRHPSEIEFPREEFTRCPYAFYEAMRREEPIYRIPGQDAFLVSRWEDIAYVAHHPELFSADAGEAAQGVSRDEMLARFGLTAGEADFTPLTFSRCDGAEHRAKRVLAAKLVSRERLAAVAPFVERTAHGLIDAFAGRGEVELVSEFSAPLPNLVICELLGMPQDRADLFMRISQGTPPGSVSRFIPPGEQTARRAQGDELREYIRSQVLDRYRHPRPDDFLSEFVAAHVERRGELDELLLTYLTSEASTLLFGGLVTTQHLITNTMWLLLRFPEEHRRVREDRSLIRPMLEESLRVEAPFYITEVRARQDTELAGVSVPAGASVYKIWPSGNHDAAKFDDPDTFRIGRPELAKTHLGFGRGAHLCVGAPLARLEGEIAFAALLDRLRDVRAAPQNTYEPIDTIAFRSLRELHLEFDP